MNELKDKIDALPKHHHVEIGRILLQTATPFDENQNGIFVNLSSMSADVRARIEAYLNYVELQETQLKVDETEKKGLKEVFFS
jgi:hypothetical protein